MVATLLSIEAGIVLALGLWLIFFSFTHENEELAPLLGSGPFEWRGLLCSEASRFGAPIQRTAAAFGGAHGEGHFNRWSYLKVRICEEYPCVGRCIRACHNEQC